MLADPADDARPRTLISFLGALPENVAEILDATSEATRNRGEFPVAIMSELRPDLISGGAAPIEFLPARRHLPLLDADAYERYVRRRWSLVMAKWSFADQIELGASFDDFVAWQLQHTDPEPGTERSTAQALGSDA